MYKKLKLSVYNLYLSLFIATGFFGITCAQDDILKNGNWYLQKINAQVTGKNLQNKRTVTIAVIDDGFRLSHESIKNCLFTNTNEIPNNGIDDDHNGYVDDIHGWDASDNDNDVSIPPGRSAFFCHGTSIASIILTTAGIDLSHNAIRILPIKVLSDKATNTALLDAFKGIEYAISLKPDIICCAWSQGIIRPHEQQLIAQAIRMGILVIAAAGNIPEEKPHYPAAYPGVLSVAALDSNFCKVTECAYGLAVELSAPGHDIPGASSLADTAYTLCNGSSMATAIVCGAAARFLVYNSDCKQLDAAFYLKNGAIAIDSFNREYCGKLGAGCVSIDGAMRTFQEQKKNSALCQEFHIARGTLICPDKRGVYTWDIKPYGNYPSIDFFLLKNITGALKGALSVQPLAVNGKSQEFSFDSIPGQIVIPGNSAKAVFTIKKIIKNPGPILSFTAHSVDSSSIYCQNTVECSADSGTFDDGSGKNNYAGLQDCKWLIKVKPGKRVHLRFSDFHTEPRTDLVYVFNGETTAAPVLAIFSGPNIPPEIISGKNVMLVWFVTDRVNNFAGWTAHYWAVDN